MKKMRFIAVMAAAAMALSSCGANGDLKKTAMETKDIKVTVGDVGAFIAAQIPAEQFDDMKDSAVEYIEELVKNAALGKAMKLEVEDSDKANVTAVRAQLASSNGGYEAFKKYLEENGSSIEFFDMLGEGNMYASKISKQIEEKIGDKEPAQEDLLKYYRDKYMCVKHILVKVDEANGVADMDAAKAKADELVKQLNDGADFVTLMNENSDDKDAEGNINGGETGYVFTEGDFGNPAFEDASKALKVGEYTKEPVKVEGGSYSGYHIIMRLPLPDEMGENESAVATGYENNLFTTEFDKMCKDNGVDVKIFDDAVKALKYDMLTEIPKTENSDTGIAQ